MAIGRGGLWGVGLGKSLQKIFYLPEAHTDFIFAVFCEEMGALSGVMVMLVYTIIVIRLMGWSYYFQVQRAWFCSYYCAGVASWIGLQFIVSVSVNIGLLPTKGISMPLFSYGGSHLLTSLFALGVIYRMIFQHARRGLQL